VLRVRSFSSDSACSAEGTPSPSSSNGAGMPPESNLTASLAASGLGFGEAKASVLSCGGMVVSTHSDLVVTGLGFGEAIVSLLRGGGVVEATHLDLFGLGVGVVVFTNAEAVAAGLGEATVSLLSLLSSGGVVMSTHSDFVVSGLSEATTSLMSGTGMVVSMHSDLTATLQSGNEREGGGWHPNWKGTPL